jgi:hypothetical protein
VWVGWFAQATAGKFAAGKQTPGRGHHNENILRTEFREVLLQRLVGQMVVGLPLPLVGAVKKRAQRLAGGGKNGAQLQIRAAFATGGGIGHGDSPWASPTSAGANRRSTINRGFWSILGRALALNLFCLKQLADRPTGAACSVQWAQRIASKFRAFMNNPFLSLFLLLTACAMGLPAFAEKADRAKPMNIEANTMRFDDVKQVTVIDGNVVLTKGTIVIRAEHIELREDPDGYQFGTVTGTPASPAFFRQKA